MSFEKNFVLNILKTKNIIPSKINKVSRSGQKKVFFITINDIEYVFKMIDITPNEMNDEYDGNVTEIEEYKDDKNYVLKEKIVRFKNELQMAKNCTILPQLRIFNSFEIFLDDEDYYLYYIEEKFEGENLASLYKRGIFTINEVIDFIEQMVKQVEIMYNNKYIHRDIKPQNIIVNNSLYKVIDGGLCKNLEDELALTRTPDFIGTYRYAAPEQEKRYSDFIWDFTTDLFPIGLIAIELFLKDARNFNEKHLRDMDFIYSKWKNEDERINYLFSKLIIKLCSESRARRFNSFDEIYEVIDNLKLKEVELI